MTVVHLDYTALDREPTRLRIEQSAGGYYSVLDQHNVLHLPAFRDLDLVISWMRRAAVDGALLDEDSIEFFRAERVFGSPSLREGTVGVGREQASPVTSATTGEPTPLPQNVHPIRR